MLNICNVNYNPHILTALRELVNTVKEVRCKVSFDSQNGKYASQLSCDASAEAYLSLRVTVKRICHLVNEM
jgi:hypothetical protein